MSNITFLEKTGIRRVHFYVAPGPVETCDRCSAAIRNVALVTYKDGESRRFGSECIKKILAQAPDLRKLFTKNAKLLQRYTEALRIFSLPPEQMPRGNEYFGSGMYFIADSTGEDINGRSMSFFHPLLDWDKNQSCGRYVQNSEEEHSTRCLKDIEKELPWFKQEVTRLEGFLARVLNTAARRNEII